jgi:hypothetical protein
MTEASQPRPIAVTSPQPPGPGRSGQDVYEFLYTHNPCYAISAALVFWGLRTSFDTSAGDSFQCAGLMIGLVAYTLLLAATTLVVIRVGKVWEDGRSQLLLIVLMLLATSVSFDDALARNPQAGILCYVGGLALSIAVSEAILRGLPLRLPVLYRLPYYLVLGLFFLYPIAAASVDDDPFGPIIQWTLFAFPAAAGAAALTLLPAVRRGPSYVRDNGSPWRWPWYPWSMFIILGLGVCGRSYYLCVSLHQAGGHLTIFGTYFLVPFLFAVLILLLEMGLVWRSTALVRAALVCPAGILALVLLDPGHGKVAMRFLELFRLTFGGTPLYLTAMLTAVFCAYALVRRAPHAAEALCAAMLALAVAGPHSADVETLTGPQPLPILLAGLLQLGMTLRTRSSARCLAAAVCLVAAGAIHMRGALSPACHAAVAAHVLLAAVLWIGAAFRDPFARVLKQLGAVALLAAGLAAIVLDPVVWGDVPAWTVTWYPVFAAVVAAAYGWLVQSWFYYLAASGGAACWAALAVGRLYLYLRQLMVGLDYVLGGLAFLLLAAAISLTKSDVVRRRLAAWRRDREDPERR